MRLPIQRYNGWDISTEADGPLVKLADVEDLINVYAAKAEEAVNNYPPASRLIEEIRRVLKIVDGVPSVQVSDVTKFIEATLQDFERGAL